MDAKLNEIARSTANHLVPSACKVPPGIDRLGRGKIAHVRRIRIRTALKWQSDRAIAVMDRVQRHHEVSIRVMRIELGLGVVLVLKLKLLWIIQS